MLRSAIRLSVQVLPALSVAGLILALFVPIFADSHADVTIIVVGDSRGSDNGVNVTILAEIAEAIVNESVEFVLFPGDLVTGSSDSATLVSQLMTWRSTMQPVYDAGILVYPCRGNHDIGDKGAWDQVFAGVYALPANGPSGEENITFSFSHENVFIVGLDQYVTPHRVNQTWLDEQFALNTEPLVFIFGHEPAFSTGHTDCLDDYPTERNAFWSSIAAEGGRFYFAGHDHFYNHARLEDGDGDLGNDVYQYIVGSAGAPLRTWDGLYDGNNGLWAPILLHHERNYGYLVVEASGELVSMTWKHRIAPGVYEAERYGCGDADASGFVDIDDIVYLIDYTFSGGPAPEPVSAGDSDCNGQIDIDDAVFIIGYVFGSGNIPCDTDGDGDPDC
jgi:hypothetical protein